MHKVEHHVGRLIEVKLASPLNAEEVQQFVHEHIALMQKIKVKYVGVVDLREAYVFPPGVTDTLIQLLSGANSHVERSALLIGGSATFSMQVERVIRTSNNPNRRAFHEPDELAAWLGEVLTPHERARLELFLRASRLQRTTP